MKHAFQHVVKHARMSVQAHTDAHVEMCTEISEQHLAGTQARP